MPPTGDPANRDELWPACKEALAHAEATMPDPYERGLRTLREACGIAPPADHSDALAAMAEHRAAFWAYAATSRTATQQRATSDVHLMPPDPYKVALDKMREAQR